MYDELVRTQTISRDEAAAMNIFELFDKNNYRQSQLSNPYGQHQIMSKEYIDFLKNTMKSFDALNGYSRTEEEYDILAWAGLHTTPEFYNSDIYKKMGISNFTELRDTLTKEKACE